MNILITNHHLINLAGSELYTKELALGLVKLGHRVFVYSPFLGLVSEQMRKKGIYVTDDLEKIKDTHLDIIHSQHNYLAIQARAYFPTTPIIFMSHGVIPRLEQPPLINIGIVKYIAVSEEVKHNLVLCGIPKNQIIILRNWVDQSVYKNTKKAKTSPRKILIISNHYEADVKDKIEHVAKILNLKTTHVGLPENPVKNIKKAIDNSDIIVSLGRGAIEAIACGRNVIVYDIHGADGMVDEDNYFELRKNNFSGRRYAKTYNLKELKKEIEKYNPETPAKLIKYINEYHNKDKTIRTLELIYKEVAKRENDIDLPNDIYLMVKDEFKKINHLNTKTENQKHWIDHLEKDIITLNFEIKRLSNCNKQQRGLGFLKRKR